MTCEIIVANRLGIALAADSAVTFSGSNGNTYASGANKIFQLASSEPVAIMIYNGASLNTIPWEILIKAYRRKLGRDSFTTLCEYRDDLLAFLNDRDNPAIHSEVRKLDARSAYGTCGGFLYNLIQDKAPQIFDRTTPEDTWLPAYSAVSEAIDADLAAAPVLPCLEAADLQLALIEEKIGLSLQISSFIADKVPHLVGVIDTDKLAAQAIETAFKHGTEILDRRYTGLVIAGFGRGDYLPSFLSLHCHGFVGNRILWKAEAQGDINHGITASLIQGFARQTMIETFTLGASPEIWQSIGSAFRAHAAQACFKAAQNANVAVGPMDVLKAVNDVADAFNQQWTFTTIEAHLQPLRAIVAGLALEELAELAENLVMLESLKEKVTSRTQSVGGPIDLAVITKEEGLVWIKRKHYFDPSLNLRYVQRLQQAN